MISSLPFQLWRFDSRSRLYAGYHLPLSPSDYIRRNVAITTSGMCANESLACAIAAMGEDNVMFSVDHPFESIPTATGFIETVAIDERVRAKICHETAARLCRV